jgi:hypothetical protein
MKYAILDYGKDMVDTAHVILNQLQSEGAHIIIYLTDADGLLCLEYITEDEFLDHYKKTNNGTK